MKLSFHGQSCVLIETGAGTLLIDPFIKGNRLSDLDEETIAPDYILLTHGHHDHLGDTVAIARRSGCMVICNSEIGSYLSLKGCARVHTMNMGGQHEFPFGRVKLTYAQHGSQLEDEGIIYNFGSANGIILTIDGKVIYHAGDTGLFGDLELIGRLHPIDLAFVPIGDNYTMGIDDAVLAVGMLKPKQVVPVHYNTFPLIAQNADVFIAKVGSQSHAFVMDIGKEYSL